MYKINNKKNSSVNFILVLRWISFISTIIATIRTHCTERSLKGTVLIIVDDPQGPSRTRSVRFKGGRAGSPTLNPPSKRVEERKHGCVKQDLRHLNFWAPVFIVSVMVGTFEFLLNDVFVLWRPPLVKKGSLSTS